MLLFLTIDLTDERLSLSNDSFDKLPLLFCWTCTLAQDLFYYKIKNNDKVDILYYKKGEMESDFPYPNYPIYFPQKYARLEEITSYYQDILTKLNGGRITPYEAREMDLKHSFLQHQICGEPFLIQGDIDILSCPICKQQMAFLVKIGDDCGDSRGFVGNAWVQVNYYYCKNCFVVGTMQQCD